MELHSNMQLFFSLRNVDNEREKKQQQGLDLQNYTLSWEFMIKKIQRAISVRNICL